MAVIARISLIILIICLFLCAGAAAADEMPVTDCTDVYSGDFIATNAEVGSMAAYAGTIGIEAWDAWQAMAPVPEPRAYSAVTSVGDYVYVIGGSSDGSGSMKTNTTLRYNTTSDSWDPVANLPVALVMMDAVTIGQKIYVPGDFGTATTYVYDIPGGYWSDIPANNGYSARRFYNAVPSGTDILVLGGVLASSSAATAEVWRLDTASGTWSPGVPLPEPRANFAASTKDNQVIVTGGVNFPGFSPYLTTWIFNGTNWNAGAPVPQNGGMYDRWAYCADGQSANGDLWLAGGRRDGPYLVFNQTGAYHPGTDSWNMTPELPPLNQPRVYTSGTIAEDGYFYIAGGRNTPGTIAYDDFERLYVEPPLAAKFTGTPRSGVIPLEVTFSDTSTGDSITGRVWDFGDGNSTWPTTLTQFSHRYENQGVYTVSLTVTNASATSSRIRDNYINATPIPPPAVFSIAPNRSPNNGPVSITNLAGANFNTTVMPAVSLVRTGYANITATGVSTPSSSRISCTFDLTGRDVGGWNVVVTNPDGQEGVLENGFEIITPFPRVFAITPNTAMNDRPVTITNLSGSDFNTTVMPVVLLRKSGQTDIVASGVDTRSSSELTCIFDLTGSAPGGWSVYVINPDLHAGGLLNGFIVTAAPPTITSISPKSGARGKTVTIRNLSGTGYLTGATVNLTKAGKVIIMKPVTVAGPTKITGKIKIPARAKTGMWNVSVTNPDGQSVTLANGFRIRG